MESSPVNDPVYRVDLTVDKPPVVTIRAPKEDKITVVATDKVPISFTARDDFGIGKIELVFEIYKEAAGGEDKPTQNGRVPLDSLAPEAGSARKFEWDISRFVPHFPVGYTANFWIEATDNDTVFGPKISVSKKKNFVVVTEEVKKAELLDAMSKKAAEIEHLYESQRSINQKVDSTLRTQNTNP